MNPARIRRLLAVVPLMARLGWRLVRDPRVPRRHRAVLVAATGYVVSPIDVLPDFIPVIGELDDLLVIAAGLAWAIRFAPPDVLDEHLAELGVTRQELQDTLVMLLPPPLEVAYRQRHRYLPAIEEGAGRGAEALMAAAKRLRLTLPGGKRVA